jgi:hypothetical protein
MAWISFRRSVPVAVASRGRKGLRAASFESLVGCAEPLERAQKVTFQKTDDGWDFQTFAALRCSRSSTTRFGKCTRRLKRPFGLVRGGFRFDRGEGGATTERLETRFDCWENSNARASLNCAAKNMTMCAG